MTALPLPRSEDTVASGPCEKYAMMHAEGVGAAQAYAAVRPDGSDLFAAIRMVRKVYGLTLTEAKKVSVEVDTGQSIEQYQGGLEQDILKVLA
ncbi:hypothetical protein [Massilia genomosp. 1]|uniref:XRE family transcriptional regulator n=1 Tax=Massilia genomosp. 1 TaxID=2609280 RepID=A0ABX0MR66_9BURK|nr:hypothetical protein [Massilia genomosp. 1]NHZ62448.1 hypothetical protein [Massilia genomosp. 1]